MIDTERKVVKKVRCIRGVEKINEGMVVT